MSRALIEAWEATVRRHGDKTAVAEAGSGRTITYRELDSAARRQAGEPGAIPAGKRRPLAVFGAANGIRWFELLLGYLHAGLVPVPLDPGEPVAAQLATVDALRAGYWWDGHKTIRVRAADRRLKSGACLVKLTSGSTGRPRPLVFTDAQMLADGRQVMRGMGIRRGDLNYALIPFGHSYGLGNIVIPLIAAGIPVVAGSGALPGAVALDFARWQPTVFPGVTPLWRALAGSTLERGALASLRLAITAGSALPPEVARAFEEKFGRRIHAFYGSSETGGIAYDRSGAGALSGKVGRALPGVKISVVRGRPRVRSAAVISPGSWTMSDRARFDTRGNLELLGRADTIAKIAGRRVSLSEVASRLRAVPGVRDAWTCVLPGPDPVLAAAVATDIPAGSLRSALQADTPAWRIPKRWAILREFPINARGKLDTARLRSEFS